MPRKKSNKKKKRERSDREQKVPGTPSPRKSNTPTATKTLFVDSPSVKSSHKTSNHQALRILDLVDDWNAANKESEELLTAMSGLTTRMAAFRRLASIAPAARTDVLVLFDGLHEKVLQRHVEDLEDVFHNLQIVLEKYRELAASLRACSAELQVSLHRVHHDVSPDEMFILFGPPDVANPVPFETVVRAADYLSRAYTQEYWSKIDIVSSVRLDDVDLVDQLVGEWSSSSVIQNEVIDGFLTALEILRK